MRESRLDDCPKTANTFLNFGRRRLSESEAEVIRLGRTAIERFARTEDDPRFSGLQKELTGIESGWKPLDVHLTRYRRSPNKS